MGIRGLMSYVTRRPEKFSRKVELHDTKLVIDGNCIAYYLYYSYKCNYCFGGDYKKYAYYVSAFFDEFLKCNISLLIIFDGGSEDKKLETILTRCNEKLLLASNSTPFNEQNLMPSLAKDVFKYIARQKNIKVLQPLFEADSQIASLARIFKCPVLSNDSDFLIFDVEFIPFGSLINGIFENSNGRGFVKHCRVYTHDDFIKNFPGMDKKHLALAAALLGNDYIDSDIFNNFFSSIIISNGVRKKDPKHQAHCRIEKLFRWFQDHSMDRALAIVLKKLNQEKCESILGIIEMIINGYLVPTTEMLVPLGYTSEEIVELIKTVECEAYKFDRTGILKLAEEKNFNNKIQTTSPDDVMISKLSLSDGSITNQSQLNKSIPAWFLHEYTIANFPSYFMDMLNRQMIIVGPDQMENNRYPPCIFISLTIIRAIFKLLSNGTTNSKMLQYIARGKGITVAMYQLDCNDDFFQEPEFPTLCNLIKLSEIKRKNILISTLRVSDQLIMEFPPTWRLYVAVIKYWSDRADKIFVTKWHVYSLILMIVYHVVEKVIRFGSYFERSTTVDNHNQADEHKVQSLFSTDMPIKDALEKVRKTDCTKASEFFEYHLSPRKQETFNVTIVHAFSLLQTSLKHSMHFNALLGYPYKNPNVADFFSGTMIYNFYNDLRKYNQLNQRIRAIFSNSPSILQLFISTSTKIQTLLDN